jgi:hypothetical protein
VYRAEQRRNAQLSKPAAARVDIVPNGHGAAPPRKMKRLLHRKALLDSDGAVYLLESILNGLPDHLA